MIRLLVVPSIAILLGAASPGAPTDMGARIIAHGTANGVVPCRACHAARLQGNPAIGAPALAGLSEAATLAALAKIAAGRQGNNFVMRHIARLLTPPERKAIAAYLAGLKKEKGAFSTAPTAGGPLTTAQIFRLSAGAEIVLQGTTGIRPCVACHGAELQGNSTLGAPVLAGLPARRTLAALTTIAAGRMGANAAMQHIARRLDPAQREAVAAYLAQTTRGRLPPGTVPPHGTGGAS
jgi:cytochrome c553